MYQIYRCVLINITKAITVASVLFITGCDTRKDYSEDIAAIFQVLEVRQQAVASKDIALYDGILFSEYSSAGVSRDMVLDDIKLTIERFPDLSLKMPRIRPSVKRNSARIKQTSFYRTGPEQTAVQIKETLMFRKISGKWFISGGVALGLASKLAK